jgi:hypothetical protein
MMAIQSAQKYGEAESGHAEACKLAGVEYKKPKFYMGDKEGEYNRSTSGILLKDGQDV